MQYLWRYFKEQLLITDFMKRRKGENCGIIKVLYSKLLVLIDKKILLACGSI